MNVNFSITFAKSNYKKCDQYECVLVPSIFVAT